MLKTKYSSMDLNGWCWKCQCDVVSSALLAPCQRRLECLRGAASDSWDACEFLSGSELGREPHPGSSVPPPSASKSRNLQQVVAGRTTQRLHCLQANTDFIQELVHWGTSDPPPPSATHPHPLLLGGAVPGLEVGMNLVGTTPMMTIGDVPAFSSCDSVTSTEA